MKTSLRVLCAILILAGAFLQLSLAANSSIGLLIVGDDHVAKKYAAHWDSIKCYANRWKYQLFIDRNSIVTYPECRNIENFFLRKHCTASQILKNNKHISWMFVLDGDVFVVNAGSSLDRYLPTNPSIDVIHYERFHN